MAEPTTKPRLTTLSHGGGCACKIAPNVLSQVLGQIPRFDDPNILVGFATSDDAAVYRLTDELAAVATIDFFTPIVDDAYDFGRIAATNALSDIYAMGAKPLFALSVLGFPQAMLPLDDMVAILRGGADVAAKAGIAIVGGHSIDDPEPKFGLAVYGIVHPRRAVQNSTARPGDRLFLTKALGTGVISQGVKREVAEADEVAGAIASMTTLNRAAAEAMVEVGPSAATDVTGFGFLGHLAEMTVGSSVRATVYASRVPLLPGARRLAEAGCIPGGSRRNATHVAPRVHFAEHVDAPMRALLADAQTSGGLLIAVPAAKAPTLGAALAVRGVLVAEVGELSAGDGSIDVVE